MESWRSGMGIDDTQGAIRLVLPVEANVVGRQILGSGCFYACILAVSQVIYSESLNL